MKRVTGKHQRGWQFLFYLAVLLCVAALGVIGLYGYGQYQANEQYHGLRQLGEVPDKEAVEILRKAVVTEGKTERDEGGEAVQKVDFKALHQVNPEICAWIQIPDTQIDYPVLQSDTDDGFYLDHNFAGLAEISGSIYMERANSSDFEDFMTVLYGHNMRNGSMFQNLHFFEDAGFFEEHPFVYIYKENHRLTYEIFAAYNSNNDHLLNAFDFSKKKNQRDYLRKVQQGISMGQNSRKTTKVAEKDRILTLSTCTGNRPEERYLVQAVLKRDETTES